MHLVRSQFPELSATRIDDLGEGCDSVAFEIDRKWVFRFPKQADVEAGLLREFNVLPALADAAPIALPRYRFFGRPAAEFPYHFGGYRKLPGVPAIAIEPTPERRRAWAAPIAEFLSWLHGTSAAEARRCDLAALIDDVRIDALEDLHRLPAQVPVERWRAYFERPPDLPRDAEPVLVHRDFAAEHVLYDAETGALTGVIDWTDLALCHPAADFAGLYHWGGEPFVGDVLARYAGALDEAGRACAHYLAACRAAADVAFGEDFARPEYVATGVRALARLEPSAHTPPRAGATGPARARSG